MILLSLLFHLIMRYVTRRFFYAVILVSLGIYRRFFFFIWQLLMLTEFCMRNFTMNTAYVAGTGWENCVHWKHLLGGISPCNSIWLHLWAGNYVLEMLMLAALLALIFLCNINVYIALLALILMFTYIFYFQLLLLTEFIRISFTLNCLYRLLTEYIDINDIYHNIANIFSLPLLV